MEEDKADVLYVDVRAHNEVVAYTGSFRNDDSDFMNLTLYRATESLMPGVPAGYMDYDTARIKLNACFMDTPDREYVLNLLSNIVKGDQAEVKDNGITQQVKGADRHPACRHGDDPSDRAAEAIPHLSGN